MSEDAMLSTQAQTITGDVRESRSVFYQYMPHAIVFFSSACIMSVEIVAGRLIARHLGSSLYTWTSIIGVVLAGMSVGNYIGGRLADKWKSENFVGFLFLISSIACLSSLALNYWFASSSILEGMNWPSRVLLSVLCIFMCPALVLGMISPPCAKMALERSDTIGRTLGSVSAWATVGSIFGTLLTGFYLIAALGARGVVLFVCVGLAVIGLWLGPKRTIHFIWLVILGLIVALTFTGGEKQEGKESVAQLIPKYLGIVDVQNYNFAKDSNYQFVKVYEQEKDGRTLRVMSLDYLIHGYIDMEDASHLQYDYEKLYANVLRRYVGDKKKVSAFFIGGGSYTFPRWLQHYYPGSECIVSEIDPVVLEANHEAMGLARDTTIKTMSMDARNAVDDLTKDQKFDLIFGDAFNDLSVPYHLTTLEFTQHLAEHIKPDGAYLVNVIDRYDTGLLLGSFYSTLKRVFKHVYIFCTGQDGVNMDGRDTFVVAASNTPLDISDAMLGQNEDFPGSALTEEMIASLVIKSEGRILTDDDAPVENLLEPVVRLRK